MRTPARTPAWTAGLGTPRRLGRLLAGTGGPLAGNVVARVGALVALGLATVVVGRTGGAAQVGVLTLLRVLPGLVGVLVSCGLPGAAPYFLATRSADPRLRSTLAGLVVAGALASAGLWVALSPMLRHVFFRPLRTDLVALAAVAVGTQLCVAVGKACLQGADDLRGANVAIVAEEAAFLPAYAGLVLVAHGSALLLAVLVVADVVVAAGIWLRLARRGFLRGWRAPSLALAREVTGYGLRGQIGGMLSLVNLRLDFALLGALAGPAVLGTYAVASKYAELLRLPGLAVTYVLYPRFARRGAAEAAGRTAALLPRAFALNALAAVPLLALAGFVLPLLYGAGFRPAVAPAYVLLLGLVGEGVAGVVTAYLYGSGHPGANSAAMGVGVLVTVGLDLLLIRPYGALGAAVASAAAYVTVTGTLLLLFSRLRRAGVPAARPAPTLAGAR